MLKPSDTKRDRTSKMEITAITAALRVTSSLQVAEEILSTRLVSVVPHRELLTFQLVLTLMSDGLATSTLVVVGA